MKFSLIICTYMRPKAIITLLDSVNKQVLYPNEIIIVDGSTNAKTKEAILKNTYADLIYYKVSKEQRGLTKQRNFGISKVSDDMEIVCFLDDDIVLTSNYFEKLIATYNVYPDAAGVGGYIVNEVNWRKLKINEKPKFEEYLIDGFVRSLGSRNILRKKLNLLSKESPCIMPEFSNGFSVGFLPPNNKIYKAEYFMGGVSSFRKKIVDNFKFSNYFEGYGLYEDLEYCLRVSNNYILYVNTGATLYHYHEEDGRPNTYKYGRMVIRNGWYVWRIKFPSPSLNARFKWNSTAWLLMLIRLSNVITTSKRKEAFTEFVGRKIGWLSLIFNKPKMR
ncbi:glycosyltransferase family 2 protein [Xanthomarina gelatinilytica]|uniref:glycosyltransferase family 2 protein n=1 Tax=Xanthomarina gelatinilytica TaxID=1137281 RepID=UPI003AA9C4D7